MLFLRKILRAVLVIFIVFCALMGARFTQDYYQDRDISQGLQILKDHRFIESANTTLFQIMAQALKIEEAYLVCEMQRVKAYDREVYFRCGQPPGNYDWKVKIVERKVLPINDLALNIIASMR